MRLSERVESIHRDFPVDWTMRVLERLCAFDRYQASEGIEQAADVVAAAAEEAGLREVSVTFYDVTHGLKWWSFDSPRPWTPVNATLCLGETLVAFPQDRMSLATYSAACAPTEFPLYWLDANDLSQPPASATNARSSIAVLSPAIRNLRDAIAWAEQAGAAGVIADPLRRSASVNGTQLELPKSAASSRTAPLETGAVTAGSGERGHSRSVQNTVRLAGERERQRGRARIELQAGTRLFGFSVLPEELVLFERAAREGRCAQVCVDVRRSGRMPVVQGVLPATRGGNARAREILVQAHLCHPGPGANDNASGVAGALGIARVLAAREELRDRAIRFVFAPEFVGTAAYLHDFPRGIEAVINLDMLGEDPVQCGSALIVERPPDHVPSALGVLAERCLELLPAGRKSYSGAVPMPEGQWFGTPFTGASDHGLFADRQVAVPAVQLSHFPDRFNHTSSDSLDKVCPQELRRAAVVAATCAEVLTSLTADNREELARLTAFAVARELAALCQREPEPVVAGIVNPYAANELPRLVDHVLQTGTQQIASTHATSAPQLAVWLEVQAQAYRSLARGWANSSCARQEDNVPALDQPPKNARIAVCSQQEGYGRTRREIVANAGEHTRNPRENALTSSNWPSNVNLGSSDLMETALGQSGRRFEKEREPGEMLEQWQRCLEALWVGPFNLRGLAAALPVNERGVAMGHFPRLMSLALAIDGRSGREEVVRRAAYSSRLPIKVEEAHAFFDALVRAGWARE